jgi:hypothetical protein
MHWPSAWPGGIYRCRGQALQGGVAAGHDRMPPSRSEMPCPGLFRALQGPGLVIHGRRRQATSALPAFRGTVSGPVRRLGVCSAADERAFQEEQ